jgi:hypothetical protein
VSYYFRSRWVRAVADGEECPSAKRPSIFSLRLLSTGTRR